VERIAAVKPAHAADLIGVWGTAARILVGLVLVGSVLYGHATGGWHPVAWLLGLIVFPAVVLASLWWRARRNPEPMRASGPVGHAINAVIFLALYLTWWYAPTVDVLSDAALIFYGASMLLAAARGYAGVRSSRCPNALLHRDDQIGCAPFWPIDAAETRLTRRRAITVTDGGGDER
jgi:hypothetical protein